MGNRQWFPGPDNLLEDQENAAELLQIECTGMVQRASSNVLVIRKPIPTHCKRCDEP
jgi:hypothetical protein